MCIRVLIADDQPRVRRGLKALLTAMCWQPGAYADVSSVAALQPWVEIVGEAKDGRQAVAQMRALRPDVVVMDLRLQSVPADPSGLDGLAAIRIIKRCWPITRIVVLTMYATHRAAALAAGADAFLLKGCPTGELLAAVMPGLGQLTGRPHGCGF